MNHRRLQPSGDHILIQYANSPAPAGVGSARRRPPQTPSLAKVIAVGPGQVDADGHSIPLGLKVGENVLVDRTCGILIRLHRQVYAVIRKRDLIEE